MTSRKQLLALSLSLTLGGMFMSPMATSALIDPQPEAELQIFVGKSRELLLAVLGKADGSQSYNGTELDLELFYDKLAISENTGGFCDVHFSIKEDVVISVRSFCR